MELSNTKGSLKENMKSRIHEIMKSKKGEESWHT